jgi:hypothetical protein
LIGSFLIKVLPHGLVASPQLPRFEREALRFGPPRKPVQRDLRRFGVRSHPRCRQYRSGTRAAIHRRSLWRRNRLGRRRRFPGTLPSKWAGWPTRSCPTHRRYQNRPQRCHCWRHGPPPGSPRDDHPGAGTGRDVLPHSVHLLIHDGLLYCATYQELSSRSAGGNCLLALNSAHQPMQTPRSLSDLTQLNESFAAA